jgi:dTDP-glucose 4,6-dehydratase
MRLLVTGGAGFIGSNFVRRVIGGSLPGFSSVSVLDKLTYAGTLTNLKNLKSSDYEFVQGDICDAALLEGLLPGFDVVINFAAESHVDRSISNGKEFILSNIVGTHTLLNSAMKNSIKTFLQVSTDEVYGSISNGSWNEECAVSPNSPYSASKASADLLCLAYIRTHGMDIRVTRSSNNFGTHQNAEKFIPKVITNLIKGEQVPVYGDGMNIRDWIHVDDNCRALHQVLLSGNAGGVYNIGGGNELTNLELVNLILQMMELKSEMLLFVKDRAGHDLRYSVDVGKIQSELGFYPKVDFENGLADTINWYRNNQSWWNTSS